MVFRKSRFSGYICTSKFPWLVDQSSSSFLCWTREETLSCTKLSDFGYLYPFRRYSRSNWEGVRNRAKFSLFCRQIFLWGVGQITKCLDWHL